MSFSIATFLKPQIASSISTLDRVAYYGVWILTALVWSIHFESQDGFVSFFLVEGLIVLLALAPLAILFLNVSIRPSRMHFECFLPFVLASLWLIATLLAPPFASGSVMIFVLLALLSSSLARPFGRFVWLSSAMPAIVAINVIMHANPSPSSMAMAVLVNLLFVALGLTMGLASPKRLVSEALRREPIENMQQKLAQERYEKNRLKNALISTERDLEFKIRDRTKALQDSNTQLSQQIALRKSVSDALLKSQTRLTQAIEASRLGLFDWEVSTGRFYQSSFHHIYGGKELSSQEVIETVKRVIHPSDYGEVRDTLNQCLNGSLDAYQLQYRVKDEDAWRWIEESGRVVEFDGNGHAARILGTRRDIQAEVQRDEEVRLAKSVFDHTSEGVFVLDAQGRFLSSNPAYSEITGHDPEQLFGQLLLDISATPQKEQVYAQIFTTLDELGLWQGELLEQRLHGDYFPQWTQINAIKDESGQVKYFAGLISDLSDRKAADDKLDYLLNYDSLTKLANRVQFQNQLHRALVRFQNNGLPFALVLMDIDRFKHFNDSFGHKASDAILQSIAERLSSNVQRVDVLARIGGNEFACIVACSPTFEVTRFAKRLFDSLTDKPYQVAGHEVVLSCSIGIALVPEHTESIEALIGCGALAVQKAKYHGGNQIQVFDESLITFSRERLEIEKELRTALSNNELEVYYQPKLDLHKGLITSYEALVRWRHPVRGLISPDEFVAIAEENGLISDLGFYVLNAACEQTKAWQDQGLGELSVSVNLSPRQLLDPALKSVISDSLENTGIEPRYLELELTESALMEDITKVVSRLSDLRELGLKISIDDFGTGYSSLSYLRTLPVDTLKIDREFIENIENSKAQQAIVKAIIVLAGSLDLHVVAEGAENEAQLELLRDLGCDYVQGYYVSRPVDQASMETMLQQQ
jgi:diguanylate cyclase (GGDEF)-like protein/PAS domain S-box-containing protein